MNSEQIRKQARLIKTGDAWGCYVFARYINDADIALLQARVLEIGNADECRDFARYVKGADKAALKKRIAELEATK